MLRHYAFKGFHGWSGRFLVLVVLSRHGRPLPTAMTRHISGMLALFLWISSTMNMLHDVLMRHVALHGPGEVSCLSIRGLRGCLSGASPAQPFRTASFVKEPFKFLDIERVLKRNIGSLIIEAIGYHDNSGMHRRTFFTDSDDSVVNERC